MQDVPIIKSEHPDCFYYKHESDVEIKCCGGTILKEIVEMIFCGKVNKIINSIYCKKCKNFRQNSIKKEK